MALIFNKKSGAVTDTRSGLVVLDPLRVCYTLNSDDITRGEKPWGVPYIDRKDTPCVENGKLVYASSRSRVNVSELDGGLLFELDSKCEELCELGLVFPFHFMGKKGGKWQNQHLFNSPYSSHDKKIIYSYLSSPSGNDLVACVLSEADGWKMDYSPFSFGHYFMSLRFLANYDRAYKPSSGRRTLKVALFPCSGFDDALSILSRAYGVPFLDYSVGGGALGETVALSIYGEADSLIEICEGKERVLPLLSKYTLCHEGEVALVPVKGSVRGAEATLYAYNSLTSLYKRSMDTVELDIIKTHTDSNLCEHQCWASAMLRYLLRYKHTLSEAEVSIYEDKLRTLLSIITESDPERATPRITILKSPHDSFGAYNVFKSRRVQELFFGITILLDAYKYFGNELYYEYAVGAMDCLLRDYQAENGAIMIDWGDGSFGDYSTVCAPMIPLVDMARFLADKDPTRSAFYFECAEKMASHLFKRGLCFPTEGAVSSLVEAEMEDGSISCTALCLLYFCKNVRSCDDYIATAREILDIHDSWVIKAPICQMHGSSLRWWETQWEGEADGPAICAGHAWSIWRAEADYLLYSLTGEQDFLTRAKNGFITNLSKIDKNGNSYAIYSPDEINGGGFHSRAEELRFELAPRFSRIPDCGLSRYVWIRINDTLLEIDN